MCTRRRTTPIIAGAHFLASYTRVRSLAQEDLPAAARWSLSVPRNRYRWVFVLHGLAAQHPRAPARSPAASGLLAILNKVYTLAAVASTYCRRDHRMMVFVNLGVPWALVALLALLSRASRAAEELGWKPYMYSMCSGCVRCLADGNTLPECESFGSDCSCYHRECACATCVSRGKTVRQCESYGSDCACYSARQQQAPASGSQQAPDPQASSQQAEGSAACANLDSRMQALHDQCCGRPGQGLSAPSLPLCLSLSILSLMTVAL